MREKKSRFFVDPGSQGGVAEVVGELQCLFTVLCANGARVHWAADHARVEHGALVFYRQDHSFDGIHLGRIRWDDSLTAIGGFAAGQWQEFGELPETQYEQK